MKSLFFPIVSDLRMYEVPSVVVYKTRFGNMRSPENIQLKISGKQFLYVFCQQLLEGLSPLSLTASCNHNGETTWPFEWCCFCIRFFVSFTRCTIGLYDPIKHIFRTEPPFRIFARNAKTGICTSMPY